MNPIARRIQTCREKAGRARRLAKYAKSVTHPATQEQLEIAASDYDQMADHMVD
jgi:hypothetical protein